VGSGSACRAGALAQAGVPAHSALQARLVKTRRRLSRRSLGAGGLSKPLHGVAARFSLALAFPLFIEAFRFDILRPAWPAQVFCITASAAWLG